MLARNKGKAFCGYWEFRRIEWNVQTNVVKLPEKSTNREPNPIVGPIGWYTYKVFYQVGIGRHTEKSSFRDKTPKNHYLRKGLIFWL